LQRSKNNSTADVVGSSNLSGVQSRVIGLEKTFDLRPIKLHGNCHSSCARDGSCGGKSYLAHVQLIIPSCDTVALDVLHEENLETPADCRVARGIQGR
jgi:hypothetical protein